MGFGIRTLWAIVVVVVAAAVVFLTAGPAPAIIALVGGIAAALIRELDEEIGLRVGVDDLGPIGCFSAVAANGPGHRIDATVFHLCSTHAPVPAAEIEEAIWIDAGTAETLTLAPLLREHILPWYRQMLAHP